VVRGLRQLARTNEAGEFVDPPANVAGGLFWVQPAWRGVHAHSLAPVRDTENGTTVDFRFPDFAALLCEPGVVSAHSREYAAALDSPPEIEGRRAVALDDFEPGSTLRHRMASLRNAWDSLSNRIRLPARRAGG
jgi:hypothetical protein